MLHAWHCVTLRYNNKTILKLLFNNQILTIVHSPSMKTWRRTMRPRLARQVVVALSTLILLLCQTAAAVFACTLTPSASAATAAQASAIDVTAAAPCEHHALNDERPLPAHDCATRCPSRDASFETAKIHVPDATAVLLTVVDVRTLCTRPLTAQAHGPIVAHAASPPLILAYCRLLI